MEVIAEIILLLPFSALCAVATVHLIRREERERNRWLRELSRDYGAQWQEFEVQHKDKFENEYWNTTVNHPERVQDGG